MELPAATSGTGGLWQQCHSLAGPAELQPRSEVMGAVEALMMDEESSSCLGFCHLPCLGTCLVPGCAIQHRTPSLPAAGAAEIAHAPYPAVNLGCNSALLEAGAGDSPPASSRPALTRVFPVLPPWQQLHSQSLGWLLLAQPVERTKGPKAAPRGGTTKACQG